MGKFNRTNFYRQNLIDGVVENDLAFNGFDDFQFKRPRTYYTITETTLYRPDLISLKTLGTIEYWWILLKLNSISDVYNDMFLGKSIVIPSIADCEAFYIQTRREVDL